MQEIRGDVRRILCDEDLGLDLVAQTTYYADDDDLADGLQAVREMLAADDFRDLRDLAQEDDTARRVDELWAVAGQDGWDETVRAYVEGLAVAMEREAAERAPLPECPDLGARIRATVHALDFVAPDDPIEILGGEGGPTYVDLVLRQFSPEYDGTYVLWRDTHFKFEFLFESGLFIWLYGNVAESARGRRVGTRFFEAVEALARDLGFRRFCVPGPNKPYWEKVMGYEVHPAHQVGAEPGFVHEAYKRLRDLA
mgnify:CR=1 FL=1